MTFFDDQPLKYFPFSSHLPCCGATQKAVQLGLHCIINGIGIGSDPKVLFIDPKGKFDVSRMADYVDETIDNAELMIDVDTVMNNFKIGKL